MEISKEAVCEFLLKDKLHLKSTDINDIIDKCVDAAHRDTLTGGRFMDKYPNKNADGENVAVAELKSIIKKKGKDVSLTTDYLLEAMKADIEFGAKQKIINMTLKYVVCVNTILQTDIKINIDKCDCPIDSNIIKAIDEKRGTKYAKTYKWTRLTKDEYDKLQDEIDRIDEGNRMCFDFLNW